MEKIAIVVVYALTVCLVCEPIDIVLKGVGFT